VNPRPRSKRHRARHYRIRGREPLNCIAGVRFQADVLLVREAAVGLERAQLNRTDVQPPEGIAVEDGRAGLLPDAHLQPERSARRALPRSPQVELLRPA
jgi:hypothetical protein